MAGFCAQHGFNYTTVLKWLDADSVRGEMYARAREDRSDKLADEIVAISDQSEWDTYTDDNGNVRTNQEVVARAKLRVDARKWVAAKLKPRVYGDKLDLTQTVTIKDLPDDELLARAAKLQALLTGTKA